MPNKLLVLEESTWVLELFQSALPDSDWGWQVHLENIPANFLSAVQEFSPKIILLSNSDQKANYAILKAIRETTSAPVILLTSARDRITASDLEKIGAKATLRKPFEFETLENTLHDVMANLGQDIHLHADLDSVEVVEPEVRDLLSQSMGEEISTPVAEPTATAST